MKIKFLSAIEARWYFTQPDEYAQKLPLSNLKMICPENPTIEGYQEVFLQSFDDFDEDQKIDMLNFAENLIWLDLEIKVARTDGSHALDITQTRKDVILITGGYISEKTFVHEVYHILSRKNPNVTPELAKLFGYKKVKPQKITHPAFLLNPDAIDCNYSIVVQEQFSEGKLREKLEVTPFVTSGLGAGLKVVGKDEYVDSRNTNYYDLIPNTTYLAHPEEVCAEYFTLMHLGGCIFYRPPKNNDRDMIELYRIRLEELCNEQGLTQGIFPQEIAPMRSPGYKFQNEDLEENENEDDSDQEIDPVINQEEGILDDEVEDMDDEEYEEAIKGEEE